MEEDLVVGARVVGLEEGVTVVVVTEVDLAEAAMEQVGKVVVVTVAD